MGRARGWAILATSALLSLSSTACPAADLKVVVTIKPLHALVAQVMSGVGSPELLVKGAGSPHTHALKPSEARALHAADVFVRMADTVEPFAVKIAQSLPRTVEVLTLQEAPRL